MARLILKSLTESIVEFACYSERGIMSYFMFRVAVSTAEFCRFLRSLEFSPGAENPFSKVTNSDITQLTIFSEIEVGQRLGNPDGAFFFVVGGEPYFLWIQAKGNETYNKSCSQSGSSSAKKQLDRLHEAPRRYAVAPFTSSSEGVNMIFREYVSKVKIDHNYFLLISDERRNPFSGKLQDREKPNSWANDADKFCWLDVQFLERSQCM